MKDVKVLKLSNGKTYDLCLTAKKAAKVEREVGKPILEILRGIQGQDGSVNLDMDTTALLLSAEIISEDVDKEQAIDIMDKFFDDGHDFGELFLLISESLGFLKVAPQKQVK